MGRITRFANLTTGGPVRVDVQDGRIVRMVPLGLDESDGPSWTIGCIDILTPKRSTLTSTGMAPDSCLIQVERWAPAPA